MKSFASSSIRRRVARSVAIVAALVLVPLVAGVANAGYKLSTSSAGDPPPIYRALPANKDFDPAKKVAVVLSSSYGAEITDFLPTYEVLARSGAFNVFALAPDRKVLPLVSSNMAATGLDVVPDYSFQEYDSRIGRQPDIIAIPWFPNYTPERDAAVTRWIQANAGPNTVVLTICAGTEIFADTDLLNGHTATTHSNWFARLEPRFPTVKFVHNVRYIDDGNVITSANLASGIDATLRAVARLAGRSTALKVAEELGYRATSYIDDPRWTPDTAAAFRTMIANAAFEPVREKLGVLLYDGMSEMGLASVLDLYGSSMVGVPQVVGREQTFVSSRNGLVFAPRVDVSEARNVSRIVVPAGDDSVAGKATIDSARTVTRVPVETIHARVGSGISAYDATVIDLARRHGGAVATAVATMMYVPVEGLQVENPGPQAGPIATPIVLGALAALAVRWLTRTPSRLVTTA